MRRVRLTRARQQLLQAGAEYTVCTDVAAANGFKPRSRFAGHYRRTFGEPPSVTIQRARSRSVYSMPIERSTRRFGSRSTLCRSLSRFNVPNAMPLSKGSFALRTRPQLRIAEGCRRLVLGAARCVRFYSPTPAADRGRAYRLAEERLMGSRPMMP